MNTAASKHDPISGFDCQSCGACCMAKDVERGWVVLSERDILRLTPFERVFNTRSVKFKLPVLFQETVLKTDDQGKCCFLRGDLNKSTACSIYDRRPDACRDFEPGDEDCLEARKRHGVE